MPADLKRMSKQVQTLYLYLLVRSLAHKRPVSQTFVRKLLAAIRANKAPKSTLLPSCFAHFGRPHVEQVAHELDKYIAGRLIRARVLADHLSTACHGCLSYKPQIACDTCGRVHFCMGCVDYGACMACESRE